MNEAYVRSTPLSQIDPTSERQQKQNKNDIYLGFAIMQEKNNPNVKSFPDGLEHFLSSCQDFLTVVCVQIKKRFEFDDPVMELMKQLKPKYALSRVQKGVTRSIIPLISNAPRVCPVELYQITDDEWRHLPQHKFDDESDMENMEIDIFWGTLLDLKTDGGEHLFRNIARTALALFSLPHSNCDSERIFSKINLTKTKIRNRLIVPTVQGYVLTSQHVKASGGCVGFEPSKEMLSRMTNDSLYDKREKKSSDTIAVTPTGPEFLSEDEDEMEGLLFYDDD